jgi:anaerobic selenocysteine-containing dehydrogenase
MHEVIGACALDCPDACSWVVTVEAGRAVRLRGNEAHPFTRGGLCAKVHPYLEYASSPHRLRTPLRRTGPKGAGSFEPVGWDEALAEIADRMRSAIDTDGPESIWPFVGTGSLGYLQGCEAGGTRLFHALGASRHRVDICSVAGHAGLRYTTGSAMGLDPEDLAHSALVVLWGTNTLTTNLHLWPFVTAARERGAPLVVIDPVRTRTAQRADRHLAPRPGTDAALALGLTAELVRLGAVDTEYLDRWSVGWPQFRDGELTSWGAERAARVCGLETEEVNWLAERIAASRPTGIRALMGLQRHGGGGAALRALSCLPAVTGDYARRGGGLCYSTGPAYGLDADAVARPDLQPHGPARCLDQSRLGGTLMTADPPVRVLYLWAANPMVSNPDTELTRRGLLRDDLFTVVSDHVLTDTARYADLVLPATTQLEHADLHTSYSHVYLQWNEPAVEPPGECPPHTEVMRRLARELGLTEPALYASDEDLAGAALGGGHPSLAGITLAGLRSRGWARLSVPEPYLPFADGFPTPSGRFEFVSRAAEADGAGAVPTYVAPHVVGRPATGDGPGGDGTLELVTAAQHYLLNSTFATGPRAAAAGSQAILLHPRDAAARAVTDGAEVTVASERGSFRARAVVSDAVRRGVAATPKGFWAGPDGTGAVNAVTADRPSDLGGGATFHDTRVTVTPS